MLKPGWSVLWIAAPFLIAPAHGQEPSKAAFGCSAGIGFEIAYHDRGQVAVVRTATNKFVLKKRTGSLGERFSSNEATLIIDGDFAAFVADQEKSYSQCRATSARALPASSRSKAAHRD